MKVDAHVLTWNESRILSYLVRHYRTFCQGIVIHDLGSEDETVLMARILGCDVIAHDANSRLDDLLNRKIKNECWTGTDADWVICADADEFIYFPDGHEATLEAYDSARFPIVKPMGFEMLSSKFPTTGGQIYDEIREGAPEGRWYSKPILFSPKLVKAIDFSVGAHQAAVRLNDGGHLMLDENSPVTQPACYLLHFKHIRPLEEVARRYDEMRSRMSSANIEHRWGNFKPGIEHAVEKRNYIMKNLQTVITHRPALST